jgi:hypothetical protein
MLQTALNTEPQLPCSLPTHSVVEENLVILSFGNKFSNKSRKIELTHVHVVVCLFGILLNKV